jgi:cyclopropane-fatty-acyl-phospholipid synthase
MAADYLLAAHERQSAYCPLVIDRIVESGLVPEPVLRAGIRAVCALRLREQRRADPQQLIATLRAGDIAIATADANRQHYEVPAPFFARVLGPHLKYSACYWPVGVATLGDAETAMLELYAQRAQLADGQRILDLGCGWGAFTLWAAARYPRSEITAVSNSREQRAFIEQAAAARGLTNIAVRTADVRTLELPAATFDRVVSIEMFEHMRNYERLLRRISTWLRPDGALFVHVFAHTRFAYPFDDKGTSDWMAREFFTGGIMPSTDLLRHFQADLRIAEAWTLDGTHYARTAEAWYRNLVAHRGAIEQLLGKRSYQRWRVFFLACAELFGYARGTEWVVAHYRFVPQRGT